MCVTWVKDNANFLEKKRLQEELKYKLEQVTSVTPAGEYHTKNWALQWTLQEAGYVYNGMEADHVLGAVGKGLRTEVHNTTDEFVCFFDCKKPLLLMVCEERNHLNKRCFKR